MRNMTSSTWLTNSYTTDCQSADTGNFFSTFVQLNSYKAVLTFGFVVIAGLPATPSASTSTSTTTRSSSPRRTSTTTCTPQETAAPTTAPAGGSTPACPPT